MKKIGIIFLFCVILTGCTKKFNVTFDPDNGSEAATVEVEEKTAAEKPEDPYKEDYVFDYWSNEDGEFDFSTLIENDINLKAHYTRLHTVKFIVDEKVIDTRTVKDGQTVSDEISLPIPPEKEDGDFVGWTYEGKEFDLSSVIKEDMELVAEYKKRIYATSIKLNENVINIELNQKGKIDYSLSPSDTTELASYRSENEKIATVDEKGNVTPVSIGETNIVVYTEKASVKAKVIVGAVTVYAESVSFDSAGISLKVGDTITLSPVISPSDTTDKSLNYYISDKSIASVDAKGTLTGIKPGTATVTVITANQKRAMIDVTVKGIDVSGIQLDKNNLTLAKGSSISLKCNVAPANATDKTISYTSSHPEVAGVDSKGVVTAVAKGNATIVATSSNGKTSTCDVEVYVKPETITLLPSRQHLAYDGKNQATFSVTVKPNDADYSSIGWNTTGNVGGQNGAYSLETNGNFATLTCRETSRYDKSCGVYAYIKNKDGSVTSSNTVTLSGEDKLVLNKKCGDNVTWYYQDGKYYAYCPNYTDLEISANEKISAEFNNNSFIDQEHYEEKEVWLTLYNDHSHAEGFQMTLETPGGQKAIVVITVNAGE